MPYDPNNPEPSFGRRPTLEEEGLFRRAPTTAEKRYYVRQWGGMTRGRCLACMMGMLFLGLIFGATLFGAPALYNLPPW